MKEKEFIKKYPDGFIEIPIFYALNEFGEVNIDWDSMREEFESSQKEIFNFIDEEQDDLKELIKEKIRGN